MAKAHPRLPRKTPRRRRAVALQNRGGKLIMYSGSADPIVPYQDAVSYYERVIENQQNLEAPALLTYAAELGLDMGRFTRDLQDHRFLAKVQRDFIDGVLHHGGMVLRRVPPAAQARPRGPNAPVSC